MIVQQILNVFACEIADPPDADIRPFCGFALLHIIDGLVLPFHLRDTHGKFMDHAGIQVAVDNFPFEFGQRHAGAVTALTHCRKDQDPDHHKYKDVPEAVANRPTFFARIRTVFGRLVLRICHEGPEIE